MRSGDELDADLIEYRIPMGYWRLDSETDFFCVCRTECTGAVAAVSGLSGMSANVSCKAYCVVPLGGFEPPTKIIVDALYPRMTTRNGNGSWLVNVDGKSVKRRASIHSLMCLIQLAGPLSTRSSKQAFNS